VVDAVSDDEEVSVPTMVRVYVPLAALEEFEDDGVEPVPEQLDIATATAARRKTPASMVRLKEWRRSSPMKRSAARTRFVWPVLKLASGVLPIRAKVGIALTNLRLPLMPVTAALAQVEELVKIVMVAGTALVPETVASAST